jgi:hypothetical protein
MQYSGPRDRVFPSEVLVEPVILGLSAKVVSIGVALSNIKFIFKDILVYFILVVSNLY